MMRRAHTAIRDGFRSSTLFALTVVVAAPLLAILFIDNVTTAASQSCPACAEPTQQVIYAPLIGYPEASRSEIVLNCRSPHVMDVTPTFYTAEGTPVVGQVIRLQPAEIRYVDVMSLIPETRRASRWGGMSLSYPGKFMEVWAQLTLHGIGRRNSVDVLFTVINAPRSNVREAVWWMPPNGTAAIALGNFSDVPIRATLTFSDGETQNIDIVPFATEIIRRSASQRSVTINSNGPVGGLIVSGLVTSAGGDFTSSIRFYDTQNIAQPNLYATNLRLKNAVPRLSLRNTTASAITARPRFLPASGEAGTVELPSVSIAANEIVDVNLGPLMTAAANRQDLDTVSVQVINSGTQGSLIGALYSTNSITGITYDVPLRDSGLARNSAGGYPIRLDGDYTTVLSITNVRDRASKFTMQINYEGGRYTLYPQEVAAGATAFFDIRKIRDGRIPDSTGGIIPSAVTNGQIRWSLLGDSSTRLIGRSEVISVARNVSSSYSCGVCCLNSVYDGRVDPGSAYVDFGGTSQLTAKQRDRDCYGNIFPEYPVTASWISGDYSIADVNASGLATAVGAGSTFIEGSWTATRWMADLNDFCEDTPVPMSPRADMVARPTISGPRNVWWFNGQSPTGYATQITLTASPSNASSYSWQIVSGTDKASLQGSTTGNQVTVVGANKSTFHEVGIKVTVNNAATSNTYGISVRVPDHLILQSISHATDPIYSYKSTLNYRIEDQFTDLLPSAVPVNEEWTTGVVNDYSGANWRRDPTPPLGPVVSPNDLNDFIQGETNINNFAFPPSSTPCSPLCQTPVHHWDGGIRVGSTTPGVGYRAQTHRWQRYTDHANHLNRVSPAP